MNDDDWRMAAWVAFCCLVGAAAIMLVAAGAEAFVRVIEAKDAEIEVLQSRLDTRKRIECPVI